MGQGIQNPKYEGEMAYKRRIKRQNLRVLNKFVLSGGLKASPGVWKSFPPALARKLLLFCFKIAEKLN
jgi:hypothetical protein